MQGLEERYADIIGVFYREKAKTPGDIVRLADNLYPGIGQPLMENVDIRNLKIDIDLGSLH